MYSLESSPRYLDTASSSLESSPRFPPTEGSCYSMETSPKLFEPSSSSCVSVSVSPAASSIASPFSMDLPTHMGCLYSPGLPRTPGLSPLGPPHPLMGGFPPHSPLLAQGPAGGAQPPETQGEEQDRQVPEKIDFPN